MIASEDSILSITKENPTETNTPKVSRHTIYNRSEAGHARYTRYDRSCKGISRRMRIAIKDKNERIAGLQEYLRELTHAEENRNRVRASEDHQSHKNIDPIEAFFSGRY